MPNLVDAGAWAWRMVVRVQGGPCDYEQGGTSRALTAFVRGLGTDDTWANAQQTDMLAIINADDFAVAFPASRPKKYDRLRTPTRSYSVEEWRAAPASGDPVVWKLLVRGGTQ